MERIGRYIVEHQLARGGMAEVLTARSEGPAGFSKPVVLKRILPELAGDPIFVQMFLNEARLAALLNHPNVVSVFDFGEHRGQYYLAMEYIDGESLRQIIRYFEAKKTPFPERLAAQLMAHVCEGIHYAHGLCDEKGASYNIIHRDVNPENILLSKSGIPKIVDFGIAKAASNSGHTKDGMLKGKYGYMPPEQIRGDAIDRQLDVYALGVTLYEMLAGARPFTAESELALLSNILKGEPSPLSTRRPDISPRLAQVVERAMAARKQDRFADVRSLQTALEDYLAETGRRIASSEMAELVERVAQHRRETSPRPLAAAVNGTDETMAIAREGTPVQGNRARRPQRPRTVAPQSLAASLKKARPRIFWTILLAFIAGGAASTGVLLFRESSSAPTTPAPATAESPTPPAAVEIPAALPAPAAEVMEEARPASPPQEPPAVEPPVPPAAEAPSAPPANAKVAAPTKPLSKSPARPAKAQNGFFTLRTEPWCDVYIDGEKVGATPLAKMPLSAGSHSVTLRNDASGIYRRFSIRVQPGKEVRKVFLLGDTNETVD